MPNLSQSAIRTYRRRLPEALRAALDEQALMEHWSVADDPEAMKALAQLGGRLDKQVGRQALQDPDLFEQLRRAMVYVGPFYRSRIFSHLGDFETAAGSNMATAFFDPPDDLPIQTEEGAVSAILLGRSQETLNRRQLLHEVFSETAIKEILRCLESAGAIP